MDRPVFVLLPRDPRVAARLCAGPVFPDPEIQGGWTRDRLHELTGDPQGFSVSDFVDAPSHGFMVSIDPYAEEVYMVRDVRHHPEWVGDYWDRHPDLNDPDVYMGAWVYRNKVFFDVSRWVPTIEEAVALGRQHNQKAVYNLDTGQSVYLTDAYKTTGRLYSRRREFLMDAVRRLTETN